MEAAARGSAADLPVLDPTGFAQVRDAFGPAGAAQVAELVDLFASDAAEVVRSLAAAVAAGDDDGRCRLAHRLKGSALTLGAARLAGLCGGLEDAAGDLGPVRDALRDGVAAMRAAL